MTVTICPRCQSNAIRHQGDEWRCTSCLAKSPGYSARTLDDPVPFDQRPDHTAPTAPEPVRDPWAAAADRAAELGLVADEPKPEPEPPPAREERPTLTDAQMLGHLVAHARATGRTPSTATWRRDRPQGAPGADMYQTRFGSWLEALNRAGLEPSPRGRPPTPRPKASVGSDLARRGPRGDQYPSHVTHQLVVDYMRDHPDVSKTDVFKAVAEQIGRNWSSVRNAYDRTVTRSQPADAGTSCPAETAETPAAPPLDDGTYPPANESPQARPEEAPTLPGVIEAPLATTDIEAPEPIPVLIDQGSHLNRTQLQHLRDHGIDFPHGFEVDRADLARRPDVIDQYARALLATIETYEISHPGDHWLFERLCDRLERLLGIASAA